MRNLFIQAMAGGFWGPGALKQKRNMFIGSNQKLKLNSLSSGSKQKGPGRNPGRVLNPISYEKPETI
jgi:hypothetical protein